MIIFFVPEINTNLTSWSLYFIEKDNWPYHLQKDKDKVISNNYLFVSKNIAISFDEMVKQFSYTQLQVLEKVSNEYSKVQDLIPEFEQLLSKI